MRMCVQFVLLCMGYISAQIQHKLKTNDTNFYKNVLFVWLPNFAMKFI